MEISFVTTNKFKFNEAAEVLSRHQVKQMELELNEPQSMSVEEVAKAKAKEAFAKVHAPVVVEDSGIRLDALNGFPGALGKWLEKTVGADGLSNLAVKLGNSVAYADTCVCMFDGEAHLFTSTMKGTISKEPKGKNGFGWDRVFIPEGFDRTLGQMDLKEKNRVSMRANAFRMLNEYLTKIRP